MTAERGHECWGQSSPPRRGRALSLAGAVLPRALRHRPAHGVLAGGDRPAALRTALGGLGPARRIPLPTRPGELQPTRRRCALLAELSLFAAHRGLDDAVRARDRLSA